MQSPFYFIVKPMGGRRYDNIKDVSGVKLITSTSEEDHMASNRFAQVIALPLNYKGPIQVLDTLLVHHNAFKFYNDIKGRQKSGKSFFKDDLFFIEEEQFFMYYSDFKWTAYNRFCFVKPIPATESYIKKPFSEEPLMGIMRYTNKYLLSQGVNEGDIVCFAPDTEYEFNVEGEKLYRMYEHQITMKL